MKTERLEFRLTPELKYELIMLSQEKNIPVSKLIIKLLEDYLEKNKSKS